MFGQSHFGQNILGQPEQDHDLILPPWIVQCEDNTRWFQLSRRESSVEPCNPTESEEAVVPSDEVLKILG